MIGRICVLARSSTGCMLARMTFRRNRFASIIGPDRWLGVSTHNPEQLLEADQTSADYLAIGPVFSTSSKDRPDPVVGLEGVRRARQLTRKPLVAIGGITRANAASVIEAGADSVAVISDLLRDPAEISRGIFPHIEVKSFDLGLASAARAESPPRQPVGRRRYKTPSTA